jgi:hypothetical protein
MKKQVLILTLIIFSTLGCSENKTEDWRQFYIKQEKSRLTTIQKHFEYRSSEYFLTSTDSTFETFNKNHQKLGTNNTHFYKYNLEGKIVEEEFCRRSCEKPVKIIYYYDSLKRLEKTKVIVSQKAEWLSEKYFYNVDNLLIKKIIGSNSTNPLTEKYSYDRLNRMTTRIIDEFNNNVNKYLTTVDSLFYDNENNLILKKKYHIGEDLLTISKYSYQNKLLITQKDTTITKLKGYLPTPETIHHAYYFRVDYKYNSDRKIIEKITTKPDYKTPAFKVTYEYK